MKNYKEILFLVFLIMIPTLYKKKNIEGNKSQKIKDLSDLEETLDDIETKTANLEAKLKLYEDSSDDKSLILKRSKYNGKKFKKYQTIESNVSQNIQDISTILQAISQNGADASDL
tara:strand:+ start:2300 stop:2647 length:348 start_codon:yes stop_codon:yes gene_type:complete